MIMRLHIQEHPKYNHLMSAYKKHLSNPNHILFSVPSSSSVIIFSFIVMFARQALFPALF